MTNFRFEDNRMVMEEVKFRVERGHDFASEMHTNFEIVVEVAMGEKQWRRDMVVIVSSSQAGES